MTSENEALRVRIKSIEDALGLKYVPKEEGDEHGYAQHLVDEDSSWDLIPRLKRLMKWAEKLSPTNINGFNTRE